jgi:acyl carrier protein
VTQTGDDLTRIIQTVCRMGRISQLDADQDIYDAGVSSLDALGLLLELEDTFAVAIPDTEFIQARTARALAGVIAAQRIA